ncbi:MAG: metallophosphoesterase, partial [Pseudomonadales bacterium]
MQITDTHLLPEAGATLIGVDTADSLQAVLQQALAEHTPDAILATGDLVHDDPTGAGYQRFRRLVGGLYGGPILHLPGNHDLDRPMAPLLRP